MTDPSKSAIPNATIKATKSGTNETTAVKSNDQGYYTVPYLQPGTYNIEVSAAGFATLRRENIVLQTADKLNLPITLQVGQVSQQVTVVGEQELIETSTASRGLNFDPIKTQEYPLNGRQEYMLMALTPGVIFTQQQFGSSGFSGTRGWDVNNEYRINGGRNGTSEFLLNGAPISDKDGNWQLAPNIEAVQEFKVMTNTYDSQYGRFSGGTVNTTLKSGTNDWHGDVFEYWRNSVLDANTTQNNMVGAQRGKHNQHQFGGVLGGPIRKDKDFVFGSFEGWREVTPFSVVSNVPPMPMRDGQHFSQYGINIFDPLTTQRCNPATQPCKGSTYIRSPFPGNVIPASRISPIGQKVLSYYPAPNGNFGGVNQNFFATGNAGRYRYDQPMGRWDHVFSDNDKLYTLVTFQHGHEYRNHSGFPDPAAQGDIFSQRTDQNYVADWTHVISPTAVLDVRGSFGRFTSIFPTTDVFNFTGDKLGITQVFHAPTVTQNTVPVFLVDNYTQLFGNSFSWNTYNQWDFTPSLTLTHGRHTLHVGLEWSYVANGSFGPGAANGQFRFRQDWTQQLSDKNQGYSDGSAVASLLLGTPSATSSYVDNNASYYRTRPYYAAYVQDDWRVKPTLTLNLGLRYDVQIPFLERYNRADRGFAWDQVNPLSDKIIANWNQIKTQYDSAHPNDPYGYPAPPKAIYGGYLFPGVNGQPRRLYTTDWTNIQPRFGFAWNFTPKTVMRGGFGIYYKSPTQTDTTTGFNQQTPYIASLDGITPSAGLTGPYSLAEPYPNGIIPIPGAALGLLTNVGNGIGYDDPHFRIPRTYQWSFGFERELPWGMTAEASYVGNIMVHDTVGYQLDSVSYNQFLMAQKDPAYLNRQLPNPFLGILPNNSGSGSGANISAYELTRPDPIFRGITDYIGQWGRYRYDGLQVKLEKQVFAGKSAGVLTWVVSYTFSKAFEDNHFLNNFGYDPGLIHELDYQDIPQNIAVSGVWDMPFGKGRKFFNSSNPVASAIASGWRFDFIGTYQSGYPTGWPDLVNSCGNWNAVGGQSPSQWFNNNKSCYSTRAPYTLRVTPDRFGNIRNPPQKAINIALEKVMKFGERYEAQLRGEAFNVTNTPIYGGPSTSFSDSRFGMLPLGQENFPRFIQFGAKFIF